MDTIVIAQSAFFCKREEFQTAICQSRRLLGDYVLPYITWQSLVNKTEKLHKSIPSVEK